MSERGGAQPSQPASKASGLSTGGFAYLNSNACVATADESGAALMTLPSTVTRRPPLKRTITPRGKRSNPFLNADVVVAEPPPPPVTVVPKGRSRSPSSPRVAAIHSPQGLPSSATSTAFAPQKSASPPTRQSSKKVSLGDVTSHLIGQHAIPAKTNDEQQRTSTLMSSSSYPADTLPTSAADDDLRIRSSVGRPSLMRNVASFAISGMSSLGCQLAAAVLIVALLTIFALFFGAPLFVNFLSPEDRMVREYVHTLSQLQALYSVPWMSLNANDTRCVYMRVLEDGTEELDRIVRSLPTHAAYEDKALQLRQTMRAYHMMRHRARLYARSRDHSWANHIVFYPLRDAFLYGVVRHGWQETLSDVLWRPSAQQMYRRVMDFGVCMRQSEQMPCPTLAYLEEKTDRRILSERRKDSRALGDLDHESIEYLETLTRDVIIGSGRSNRWYNDEYCATRAKP